MRTRSIAELACSPYRRFLGAGSLGNQLAEKISANRLRKIFVFFIFVPGLWQIVSGVRH
jgi:hypothetical protein